MDDLLGPAVVLLLFAGLGWLLGVIGFFRANRALAELREIRTLLTVRDVSTSPTTKPPMAKLPAAEALSPELVPAETTTVPILGPPVGPEPDVPRRRRDWEELLTAKWGVWLGAAALLLSGVFLVRYASDTGLLGPGVRCIATVLLGLTLVAGSEWLRRQASGPAQLPDRAPGALAAGGVAVLFAAAYMAGPLYALVPHLLAFALLAAASLAGLALSLRTGPLVAALGIVGAFVTPVLVQTDRPFLSGLFAYLLFVAVAALAVMRITAWVWLGWATTVACAGFVLAVVLDGTTADAWAPALFLPAVGALALLLLPSAALNHPVGHRLAFLPLAALGAAELLLCLVLPEAGIAQVGVLLLVALLVGKAMLEARLDRLSWLGAGLFLLLVAVWGLPPWRPSGEAIVTGEAVIAVLPGAWVPTALHPLLLTAAATAGLIFAAGLWGERRRPHPLRWSALAAAVPVLTLGVLYARVRAFQTDDLWAGAALAVAVLSILAASAAARDGEGQRAGAHAAGATAALALGCAAVLTAQWLTVALALFVPALAAIEHRVELPALRRVALAIAAVTLCRLLLNGSVLEEATGQPPILDGLFPAYGVSIVAFAAAARMFRRRADDLAVAVLELCSAAFATALVLLEVRQWATGRNPAEPDTSFLEVAMDTSALALLSLFALHLRERTGRPTLGWAALAGGSVALVGGVGLLLLNPAFLPDAEPGGGRVLNALLPAYLVPALAALGALRWPGVARRIRTVLSAYALLAGFAYVTLMIRQAFHPGAMALTNNPVEDAELWAWSGAWLACGLALMAAGILAHRKALRLTALALVAITGAKVFLVDMSGLVGLWRVLSFLGLGLTLIALGAVYRRFVATEPEPAPADL